MARPAIHPGEIIADELEAVSMSIPDLAEVLKLPVFIVSDLVDGRASVDEDIANRLDGWLHTGPEIWLDLQAEYERRKDELGEKIIVNPAGRL